MKYVVSVSKAYKHRGVSHKKSTKKYWFIYYFDEEEGHFHSEQVKLSQSFVLQKEKASKDEMHLFRMWSSFCWIGKITKTRDRLSLL